MTTGYFKAIPTIAYANTLVTNILSRAAISNDVLKHYSAFYPYTIKEGERADVIASKYYGDSQYVWVVYFCNNIVDPVHEWPLHQNQFKEFIIKKYGSVAAASQKIMFYRVNWAGDDSVVNPAGYQALAAVQRKYWQPVLGVRNNIIYYERKKVDWAIETNKVVRGMCDTANSFTRDERVNTTGASGVVTGSNNTHLFLKHITGQFTNNTIIVGDTSGATGNYHSIGTYSTFDPAEEVYWSSVSAYDYENELNESRRHIKLVGREFIHDIENQLKTVMSQ